MPAGDGLALLVASVPETVSVRALRDHYGPRGMVLAGQTDTRAPGDAEYLVAQAVVEIVKPAPAKRPPPAKA